MTESVTSFAMDDEDLNLTPLLDCIFNLVFFFLVATNLRDDRAQLEVQLPQAAIEASAQPEERISIVIQADGTINLEDTPVTADAIRERLAAIRGGRPNVPVEVVSDARAPMQAFVDVATALSDLGIPFADLRTQPRREE